MSLSDAQATPSAFSLWSAVCVVALVCAGCVDDETSWGDEEPLVHSLASVRTVAQEEFAEELEVLLPGEWVLDRSQGERPTVPEVLDLTFLGHDATNGDVAFLLGEDTEHEVQPARVVLIQDHALLHLPDQSASLKIDAITETTLRLTIPSQSTTLYYTRW